MSMRILLRDHPNRAIALVTSSHALIFRHSPSSTDSASNNSLTSPQPRSSTELGGTPRCMVEFSQLESVDLSDYRSLNPLPIHGTLGLITINNDVFLCVITGSTKVATARPGETVEKIFAVEFYCLSSPEYDNNLVSDDPYGADRRDPLVEHPCLELQKLLGNGSFYYSTDFDLTNRLQDRSAETTMFDIDNLDESFLWNSYMIQPLVKFRTQLVGHEKEALDASRILTSVIRGFVLTMTIPASSAPIKSLKSGLPSTLTLISRLSCRRAGTRFNSRGIDDDGNVANFVESETILWNPSGVCFSYAQVRGSVPVFWEQAPGLIPGQQKISITRSKEGTQPAFDNHFRDLEQNYGGIHVVNLLSEQKPGEAELTGLYKYGVRHCSLNQVDGQNAQDRQLLRATEYDFHAETKGANGYEAANEVRHLIEGSADGFAYYLSEEIDDTADTASISEKSHRRTVVVLQQEGVFRTNCLDCLDRTNLIQTIISQMAIEACLSHREEIARSDFWMRHSSLWADNGDALSRIYAGTGALKSSFTRSGKMSLAGALADARKSATRLYINNFADKGRQNTMDVLLGRLIGQVPVHLYDPINDYVNTELAKHSAEFSSSEVINIWAGTFNLNGRTDGINEDLSEWLCPEQDPEKQPHIVVVGFQEIVELSPQQIMNSDPTRKQAWEKSVKKNLNNHARSIGSENYVLLRSGQLVGAALCIFVKASALKDIKNVEGSVKKTGMSGMAGNKGAVAIRMDYANTQLCFVTAHLAAGFANYAERNKDYHTINQGLRFQRNRDINDHHTVIWVGDFNYRIGLSSERAKNLIQMADLETLYENDQLNLQMVAGLTFPFYSESQITFMPTYKFDLGTDQYDTSEKARIPAWTDRILRKGSNLRQIAYGSAPLRFSDHRPVYALFQCTVSIVDEPVREALSRRLYEKRKAEVGGTIANSRADETDDDDLIGYDPVEPGLPPASSDRKKWWLDNGQPARSNIQPPGPDFMPNSKQPPNPWTTTDEPDWVTVHSQSTRNGSVSAMASASTATTIQKGSTTNNPISMARKLPPSIDGTSGNNGQDTQRRPSAASIASQSSSSKKAPPTVARKPLHLSSSPATGSPTSLKSSATLSDGPMPGPASASMQNQMLVRSMQGVQNEFQPPPRRVSNGVGSGAPSSSGTNSNGNGSALNMGFNGFNTGSGKGTDNRNGGTAASLTQPPPPPQPRRGGPAGNTLKKAMPTSSSTMPHFSAMGHGDAGPRLPPRPVETVDLLGDDDEMKGWEALKPSS